MDVKRISFILITTFILLGCEKQEKLDKPHLLIYCGITMVKPISKMSSIFEKKYNCEITIAQGGSEDLYQSLKTSQIGDLYLPGSEYYRQNHLGDGLLLDYVEVGYNQLALFVQKGNPFQINGLLNELTNQKYAVFLGNPEICSVGESSKKILKKANLLDNVFKNCTGIAADSREINKYLLNKQADLALNWKATAYLNDNHKFIDVIQLDESIAPKKKLLLMKLKFTKHPKLVDKFMEYAISKSGKSIFQNYGFIE